MSTSKETPDQTLARAGAAAAAQARLIALQATAGGATPSWSDFVFNPLGAAERIGENAGIFISQKTRDAVHALRAANPLGEISAAADSAAHTADTIVSAVKWVGITFLVIVGALIALWMIVLLTGAKWAIATLKPIAPQLVRAAAKGAVGA